MTSFYSRGKLLLTGEYLVLHGAKALAFPAKKGQFLHVIPQKENILSWQAKELQNNTWFRSVFRLPDLSILTTSDPSKAKKLANTLKHAQALNPFFLTQGGCKVTTELEFSTHWGLGSSSTLINNIAQWANVNAYILLKKSWGGSGYDIACAHAKNALLFYLTDEKPMVQSVTFHPPFIKKLYLVYLGKKQDSALSVKKMSAKRSSESTIAKISAISEEITQTTSFSNFCQLIQTHNDILSQVLQRPSLQQLFDDFKGVTKYLGAWGGDFALMASDRDEEIFSYLSKKGLKTYFRFNELLF